MKWWREIDCSYIFCKKFNVIRDVGSFSGAYDDEEAAAHAYDLAALKYWGQETILNFPVHIIFSSPDHLLSIC